MTAPLPPPGWYDDTELPDTRRYWDGKVWTEHRQEQAGPTSSQSVQPPPAEHRWAHAGYVSAFVFPLVGIVIGICQMRRSPGHAWRIIGLSIAAAIVYSLIFNLS